MLKQHMDSKHQPNFLKRLYIDIANKAEFENELFNDCAYKFFSFLNSYFITSLQAKSSQENSRLDRKIDVLISMFSKMSISITRQQLMSDVIMRRQLLELFLIERDRFDEYSTSCMSTIIEVYAASNNEKKNCDVGKGKRTTPKIVLKNVVATYCALCRQAKGEEIAENIVLDEKSTSTDMKYCKQKDIKRSDNRDDIESLKGRLEQTALCYQEIVTSGIDEKIDLTDEKDCNKIDIRVLNNKVDDGLLKVRLKKTILDLRKNNTNEESKELLSETLFFQLRSLTRRGHHALVKDSINNAKKYISQGNLADLLKVACRYDRVIIVEHLLDIIPFKTKDAFNWAAKYGRLQVMRFIWRKFTEEQKISALQAYYFKNFRITAEFGHIKVVRFIWRQFTDKQKILALHSRNFEAFRVAAACGHFEVVRFIWQQFTKEQKIAALRSSGYFAFYCAANNGHLDVARFLILKCLHDNLLVERFLFVECLKREESSSMLIKLGQIPQVKKALDTLKGPYPNTLVTKLLHQHQRHKKWKQNLQKLQVKSVNSLLEQINLFVQEKKSESFEKVISLFSSLCEKNKPGRQLREKLKSTLKRKASEKPKDSKQSNALFYKMLNTFEEISCHSDYIDLWIQRLLESCVDKDCGRLMFNFLRAFAKAYDSDIQKWNPNHPSLRAICFSRKVNASDSTVKDNKLANNCVAQTNGSIQISKDNKQLHPEVVMTNVEEVPRRKPRRGL